MQIHLAPAQERVERPRWVWPAVALELLTGALALPVGWSFIVDPTGSGFGAPLPWIEQSIFGDYFVPGLYLFAMNGIGMLVLAGLTLTRHWSAPWLTGVLGVGMIIWIVVQLVILPATMFLQWIFLATGFALGFIALFWLRRTGQLRAW
jgi:hypothetical protein